ncbi:MAG: chorismate synthase [Actinomycetaceae bacterium]|nr:chorismate synthase [Arcanobacterium sp.]MDD7504821.1 chorismate synthase [Actinomycetaceae bacterium]MDY6143669.1 chorismate synthase [Arcanobacterium sp.]
MIHWSTAGESHGKALIALMEGIPAGVKITTGEIASALARRRLGYGRGSRQKFEQDELTIVAGLRHGVTIGSPIAVEIGNSEWPKWEVVMAPDPVDPSALLKDAGTGDERELARNKPLTRPRPGHADLTGMNKYGFDEARPVLERASARETAARVALGAIAAAFLDQLCAIAVTSHVVRIGEVARDDLALPTPDDREALDSSPVRTLDSQFERELMEEVDRAKASGDTLGGVVEVVAWNVPEGLGSYVVDMQRLDARLAGAMMSIQAVKGVEIGDGFHSATRRGSVAHDEILVGRSSIYRETNRAGGIEGGMSNGEPIVVRLAFKPISTVPRALQTVDTHTGQAARAAHQRSDTTAVVPGAVVAEAMMNLVLAQAMAEKYGGDSIAEIRRNLDGFLSSIPQMRRGTEQ